MKLKVLILFIVIASASLLKAQTDFRPGYIINNAGDTIYGQIDYRGDFLMAATCRFKTTENTTTDYSPNDISAFRFIDSKYYVSKTIKDEKVFLEFLIKGKMNIYYMLDINGDHYFIEKEGTPLTELPYEEGVKYVDGTPRYYESTKHIGVLTYFMQDAPGLQPKIVDLKRPGHQNLIKLAKEYQHIVCNDTKCIVYEKKPAFVQLTIEPVWGEIKYKQFNSTTNEFGVYVHIWAPCSNENYFIKTGAIYNKVQSNGDSLLLVKVPVLFEYMYQAHKFKPKVSIGNNLLIVKYNSINELANTLCLNTGFNYTIYKSISLSVNLNSEFIPLARLMVDESENFDVVSYSVNVGLCIRL